MTQKLIFEKMTEEKFIDFLKHVLLTTLSLKQTDRKVLIACLNQQKRIGNINRDLLDIESMLSISTVDNSLRKLKASGILKKNAQNKYELNLDLIYSWWRWDNEDERL